MFLEGPLDEVQYTLISLNFFLLSVQMSLHKKKSKNPRQKVQKVALAANGDRETASDTAAKDIDAHPLEIGHSVVVMYRDSSHRLAKVRICIISVFVRVIDNRDFHDYISDLGKKFQQDLE